MARKAGFGKREQKKIKSQLIDLLCENPIVESACKKVGIARMTFYRWEKDDKDFRKEAQEALAISRSKFNDIAESILMNKAQDGDFRALQFWLTNNSHRYAKKKPIINNIKIQTRDPAQEITDAILSSFDKDEDGDEKESV